MSRTSAAAAAARRGGELVDVGSWDAPQPAAAAAAPSAYPRAAAAGGGQSRSAHGSAGGGFSSASSAGPTRNSGNRGAAHWLQSEPVTLAVDQASDRPLYCLGVNERTHSFVTGGADHSLRVYDFSGTLRRELYSKTSGHTEWVTTCAALSDGRVLSGAMDSKLCLWPSSGPRGVDLLGHAGSISRVMADSRDIGLSASYDRTLRVWSLASRSPRELAVLRGCGGPITAMDWHNSLVLAGTREGQVGLWDINTGARLRWLSPAGNAQLLTLQLGSIEAGVAASSDAAAAGVHDPAAYSWIVAAGGSDGWLRLYDLRSEGCIFQKRLSAGNPGSVNDVAFGAGRLLVALADGHVSVLDARSGFATVSALAGHQAPVQSVRIAPNNPDVAVSAASNGWLLVHDLRRADSEPKCQAAYALGLTTVGGINAMWVGNDRVVAVGDDGQPTILQY